MVFDKEYEFDAPQWFDFTRVESPAESQVAESWFSSALSCPPSRVVTEPLLREDVSDEKTDAKLATGGFDSKQGSNLEKVPNQPTWKGLTDKSKLRGNKLSIRSNPRISTLMRPTFSQLAKQKNPRKVHMEVGQSSLAGTYGNEVQAAKRQKLDGGLLR